MSRISWLLLAPVMLSLGCASGARETNAAAPDTAIELEQILSDNLSGTEEMTPGYLLFDSREEFDAFRQRASSIRFVDGQKRTYSVPFPDAPDFDFRNHRLLILWSGALDRPVRVVSATPREVRAAEVIDEYDGMSARPMGVGRAIGVAVPRTPTPPRVTFTDPIRE